MSIHHKVDGKLVEFASKVTYDDASASLSVNGVAHQLPKIEVVDALPAEPNLSTYYFVTT